MPDTRTIFAERLKSLREARGMTQTELSKLTGISQTTLCLNESGARVPNIEVLARYAEKLRVSADYLIGLSDDAGEYTEPKENNFKIKE